MADPGGGVDLERLASAYDHRVAGTGDVRRAARAGEVAGLRAGSLAVDAGGGRGAHAAVFAGAGARAVVIDRSDRMATEAASRSGVFSLVGDVRRLPLRSAVADLVYFHSVVHHGGWQDMLDEACRVVARGGVVWIWTFTPEHLRDSYLGRWFPTVRRLDEERFPPPDALAGTLAHHGLDVGPEERDSEAVCRRAGDWAAAVRAGFVSTLHLLDPAEVDAGLERFRAAHPDPDEEIRYDLRLAAVWGRAPSLA